MPRCRRSLPVLPAPQLRLISQTSTITSTSTSTRTTYARDSVSGVHEGADERFRRLRGDAYAVARREGDCYPVGGVRGVGWVSGECRKLVYFIFLVWTHWASRRFSFLRREVWAMLTGRRTVVEDVNRRRRWIIIKPRLDGQLRGERGSDVHRGGRRRSVWNRISSLRAISNFQFTFFVFFPRGLRN